MLSGRQPSRRGATGGSRGLWAGPADVASRQHEISDRITARRGGTRGPFLVWLRSPELCEKVEALGGYCRFESALDPRIRELSLLIAARHFDAQYSWNAHVGK